LSGQSKTESESLTSRDYAVDLLRAFGGAVLFAFPLLMTMEMWSLGFSMDRWRLVLFLALNLVLLEGLAFVAGFRRAFSIKDDTLDALAAFGVGIIASATLLVALDLISWGMTADEVLGKIAVQAVPASIGAMAARRQLGDSEGEDERPDSYGGELFLMLAGALFLAFNVAPTEEMILIAFVMTPWHALALVVVSILMLHAFVYSLEFSGQEDRPGGDGFWRSFWGYSLAGYGIALLVSLYVLWTFGRTDGVAPGQVAMMVTVLGFPSALGAAIARLVV
jgi:putative integral membrane protein (TIGR02587 family)